MDAQELIDRLGEQARVERFAADSMLFRRGDTTRFVFGIVQGHAQLRRYTVEGAALTVHRASAGDIFAEAALFSDVYHCDGEVLTGTHVAQFPKLALQNLMQNDQAFAAAFCHHMASQVQRLRSSLELRSIRSAEDRVMAALSLRLRSGQSRLELNGTWKDFATEIGLTHEALYRALKRLQVGGRLTRSGRVIQM
ncbi:Crp/Fnr family transcriptional regulator [Magnetovibrio blakemorei]|uniref:Cyclic nucleotide-binding domain-containing protein n=1 Tax=Magnetovibrio blakemorei TaxID=28181 RepID=A0A1E5QAX2_9PROT|nr:Crp/Fnr family transcriptional regulator [Magnetovibrio blakemorei]OEJ69180.1 hypothetical protein BEN30_03545 [Magnetovibrio blakemorei]